MIEARNFQFLFFGLGAAWVIVILYIFYLVSRERKIEQELARLKNMLADRDKT